MENLSIFNSNIEVLAPNPFDVKSGFKRLYLEKVHFTKTNRKGYLQRLFHISSKADKLYISNCDLGHLNYTLIDGDFNFANISNNSLSIGQEVAMRISANNINITGNQMTRSASGRIALECKDSLHMENNQVANSKNQTSFDMFDIKFGQNLRTVILSHSNLGRIESNFMSGVRIQYLEISHNNLKLDSENIFNIEAGMG